MRIGAFTSLYPFIMELNSPISLLAMEIFIYALDISKA